MVTYSTTPYYFATVRKITSSFGSIFNNIHIQRFTNPGGQGSTIRTIKVPLQYAAGSKWYVHRVQDIPAQEQVQTKISFPRISFELTNMQYNPDRKLKTLNQFSSPNTADAAEFLLQLNPVPYDLFFDVHIGTKNVDDSLQIIEQILPIFQPSFNLNINDIPELAITKDVPVMLTNVQKLDNWEGSFEDERLLEWTLSFTVKGYLYPPIFDGKIIKKVFSTIYKDAEMQNKETIISVKVDPIDADFTDDWEAVTTFDYELDSNEQ